MSDLQEQIPTFFQLLSTAASRHQYFSQMESGLFYHLFLQALKQMKYTNENFSGPDVKKPFWDTNVTPL